MRNKYLRLIEILCVFVLIDGNNVICNMLEVVVYHDRNFEESSAGWLRSRELRKTSVDSGKRLFLRKILLSQWNKLCNLASKASEDFGETLQIF